MERKGGGCLYGIIIRCVFKHFLVSISSHAILFAQNQDICLFDKMSLVRNWESAPGNFKGLELSKDDTDLESI